MRMISVGEDTKVYGWLKDLTVYSSNFGELRGDKHSSSKIKYRVRNIRSDEHPSYRLSPSPSVCEDSSTCQSGHHHDYGQGAAKTRRANLGYHCEHRTSCGQNFDRCYEFVGNAAGKNPHRVNESRMRSV